MSLLSNLVAAPLASGIVLSTAAAHATGAVGLLFAHAASGFSELLLAAARWCARIPAWDLPDRTPLFLLAALVASRAPRSEFGRRCVASILVLCALVPTEAARRGPMEIVFLDVGQGDAALVTFPGGGTLMVDTGPSRGSGALAEYLRRKVGSGSLDVVITHGHADHEAGLERIRTTTTVRVHQPEAGAELALDPEVRVFALAPVGEAAGENDRSVVLLIVHGRIRVLLTGDIEGPAESALVQRWGTFLEASLVKVPHHGSGSSSHAFFVERVAGQRTTGTAVVSVGNDNRFGLPDPEPLRRWSSRGYRLLATSGGSVTCLSNGTELECDQSR